MSGQEWAAVGSHLGSCSVLLLAGLCSGPLNLRIVLGAWRLLNIHLWRLQSQGDLINCAGACCRLYNAMPPKMSQRRSRQHRAIWQTSAPGNLVPWRVLHKMPEAHNEKALLASSGAGEAHAVGPPPLDVLITKRAHARVCTTDDD